MKDEQVRDRDREAGGKQTFNFQRSTSNFQRRLLTSIFIPFARSARSVPFFVIFVISCHLSPASCLLTPDPCHPGRRSRGRNDRRTERQKNGRTEGRRFTEGNEEN